MNAHQLVDAILEKGGHASRLRAALADVDDAPTEAEIEAGNYAKGHVHLHGLDITIENAKGSTRSGTDKDGKEWSVTLPASYGYIRGTKGKDKDQLDVYIGPDPASELVVIVNQQTLGGRFDEHKIMLGFSNEKKATETYDKAFSGALGPKLRKSVHVVTMAAFRKWIEHGNHKEPFKPSKLTESGSGFRMPENWDRIDKLSQTEFSIHAGANDWENTLTAAAAYFGGNDRGERVWIMLDIPGACDDSPPDDFDEDSGDKLVRDWVNKAKVAKKADEAKHGTSLSWKPEYFVAAAKELGRSVKDYGVEKSNWEASKVVESLLGEADERIVAASIRLPDGSEFDDSTHYGALAAAVESGRFKGHGTDPESIQELYDGVGAGIVDGFRTSEGRFVDREEAAVIALKGNKIAKGSSAAREGWLDSADMDDFWSESRVGLREHVLASAEPRTPENLRAQIIFAGIVLKQVFAHLGSDQFSKNRKTVIQHALNQTAARFHVVEKNELAVIRASLEAEYAKLVNVAESETIKPVFRRSASNWSARNIVEQLILS